MLLKPHICFRILLGVLVILAIYYVFRPSHILSTKIESQFFLLFFYGGLSAYIYRFEIIKKQLIRPLFSMVGICSLAYLFFFFDTSIGFFQYFLLFIFFLPVSLGNSMFGFLNKNFSILLGEISYSIYLIHGLILYIFFTMLLPYLSIPHTVSFQIFLCMIVLCLVLIILSWATYLCIERPFIHLGKSIK